MVIEIRQEDIDRAVHAFQCYKTEQRLSMEHPFHADNLPPQSEV